MPGRDRALRAGIARARSLVSVGRFDEARALVADLKTKARVLGASDLVVTVEIVDGTLAAHGGDRVRARELLETAYYTAAADGYDFLAFDAASALVFVVGFDFREFDEALRWAAVAEGIAERIGVRDRLPFAFLLGSLFAVHLERSDFPAAERELERMRAVLRATVGEADPQYIRVDCHLAQLREAQGRLTEAEAASRRCIDALRVHAVGDAEIADALGSLGLVLQARGKSEEALEVFEEAVPLIEAMRGADSVEMARNRNNLGLVLDDLERYDEAVAALERAREIFERAQGPDSLALGFALGNLGESLAGLGRVDEALRVHTRALVVVQQALPADHPLVAITKVQLGTTHRLRGELTEAHRLHTEAARALETSDAPSYVIDAHTELGHDALALGDFDEAHRAFTRALAAARPDTDPATVGELHFGLARALRGLARETEAQQEAASARTAFASLGDRAQKKLTALDTWSTASNTDP